MLIPNNPNLNFDELNRCIQWHTERYQAAIKQDVARPTFNPNPPIDKDTPSSWEALTQLSGEDLIRSAFPTLLGRKAEPHEWQSYVYRLNQGWDVFEILAELRYCPEGIAYNYPVHGLRRARMKNTLRRIPVLGNLALSLYAFLQSDARNRYYNARFNEHAENLQTYIKLNDKESNDLRELHMRDIAELNKRTHNQIQQLQRELEIARTERQELIARLSHLEQKHAAVAPKSQP